MDYKLLLMPIIGALIGWLTNWLAIKLIFKPYQPYSILFFNLKIQGLLPKRQNQLAKSVGRIVEKELLPSDELVQRIEEMNLKQRIEGALLKIAEQRLEEKLRFIPSALKIGIRSFVYDLIQKELDKHLDKFILNIQQELVAESNLSNIVEEQIRKFDLAKLESIVLEIVSKELRHIEILGGVLGFLVGIIQLLIIIYL